MIHILATGFSIIGWVLYAAMMWRKLGGHRNLWIACSFIFVGLACYFINDMRDGSIPMWVKALGGAVAFVFGAITVLSIRDRFWSRIWE